MIVQFAECRFWSQYQVWNAARQRWGLQERDCFPQRERSKDGHCSSETWTDYSHSDWGPKSCQRETCNGWGLFLFSFLWCLCQIIFCNLTIIQTCLCIRVKQRVYARREICWSWLSAGSIRRRRLSWANNGLRICSWQTSKQFRYTEFISVVFFKQTNSNSQNYNFYVLSGLTWTFWDRNTPAPEQPAGETGTRDLPAAKEAGAWGGAASPAQQKPRSKPKFKWLSFLFSALIQHCSS